MVCQMRVNEVFCCMSLNGTHSVVAIFLLPMPAVAILTMAKSSCAGRTIFVVKMLTNTWDLWYMDVMSLEWVSCRSEMCKNLLLSQNVQREAFFIERSPKQT